MDIEKLIAREAPKKNKHDMIYRLALRKQYLIHKNITATQLKIRQSLASSLYIKNGATHENVARCVVIYELLMEK